MTRDGLHSLPACDLDADAAAQAEALRAGVAALLHVDRARVHVSLRARPATGGCAADWVADACVDHRTWGSRGTTPAAACAELLELVGLCVGDPTRHDGHLAEDVRRATWGG